MAIKTVTYAVTRGMVGADAARRQRTLNDAPGESLTTDGALTFNAIKQLRAKFGLAEDGQCSGMHVEVAEL